MAKISCHERDWQADLEDALRQGGPVELHDLNYTTDGAICEILAIKTKMDMVFIAQEHLGRFTPYPQR
jgi:hypothetical protein